MKKIKVDLGERAYDILISAGITNSPIKELNDILGERKILTVTDTNVSEIYKLHISQIIDSEFSIFQAGEENKTLETMGKIYHDAVCAGLNRKSVITGFGGGVSGDIAGFAASSYMRGIDFVQIPTTLLAMVDSSVGGKTGVDLPEGKNLVGAFWQPQIVIIDTHFLQTLPKREILCGLAEIVKYAVIMDSDFFDLLEQNVDKLINLDLEFYEKIIAKCCELKAYVVKEDEKENGLRAILNYGHTFGHAIEKEANYGEIQHGEGVSIGMSIAADLAVNVRYMQKEDAIRQENLLKQLGLPTSYSNFQPEKLFENMSSDKKKQDSKTRLILPSQIGIASLLDYITKEDIISAIRGRKN